MTGPSPRPGLAGLSGYHSPQVDVDVRLNTNEAPEGPPSEFAVAVSAAINDIAWHRYPDRSAAALRSGLANLHEVTSEQIFAANGSNEVLQTLLLTYAGCGGSVLTFEPTYRLHQHISRIVGANVVMGERRDDFSVDVPSAVELITRARPDVTFLCTPNNPTRVVDSPDDLQTILAAVTEITGLLVVDEAYGQFADWSALSLLTDPSLVDSQSLVVTRTYSKTWAMAGARLGYAVAPEVIVSELEKVVLPYHLDVVTQAAGTAALQFVDQMEKRVAEIVSQRSRIEKKLVEMGYMHH